MNLSQHTILSPLRDSENWFIMNILTAEADILKPSLVYQIKNNKLDDPEPFKKKGYIMDPEEEKKLFRDKYLNFIEQQDKAEVQVFYVPSYLCNFACTYCYQESYQNIPHSEQRQIIDAFFRYLEENMAGRPFYVTLFGGEPLLEDRKTRENIAYFLDEADRRQISLAIVSNGYSLESYLPRLKRSRIREVQITLDGPAALHDIRRPLKGGQPTFEKVSQSVSLCLEAGINVNLRVVLDKQNMSSLAELADHAIRLGWTDSPLFKSQLGRNYELHSCQINHSTLYSRVEMYEELYKLLKEFPQIGKFHKPAFSISRFLFENGELPEPLFDSCPAAKTEWAMDYTGKIYPCTAMVGKKGEELGTFYPAADLKEDKCETWQDRDVLSINECRNCSLQLACGGGCGAVAKNRTGSIHSPDCRPVRELMEMGISHYFKQGEGE